MVTETDARQLCFKSLITILCQHCLRTQGLFLCSGGITWVYTNCWETNGLELNLGIGFSRQAVNKLQISASLSDFAKSGPLCCIDWIAGFDQVSGSLDMSCYFERYVGGNQFISPKHAKWWREPGFCLSPSLDTAGARSCHQGGYCAFFLKKMWKHRYGVFSESDVC